MVEIATVKGLAYAQYYHTNSICGALIRILLGFHASRPSDFAAIVKQREAFVTFVPLQAIVSESIFEVVANEEVPEAAKPFPLFRAPGTIEPGSGRVLDWWLWDGEQEWRVGNLAPDQYHLPIRAIWDESLLVERIVEGWTPARAEEIAARHREHRATLPDPPRTQGIQYFLYFPDKATAERAAAKLTAEGYPSEVRQSANDADWLVLVSDSISQTVEEFIAMRSRLEALAASLGGKYDGWEMATRR